MKELTLTYKQLCENFNIPYLSGNQKKYQLKRLKQYFDYEKVGTKYIIKNIYETPPAIMNNKNAITMPDIRFILLSVLSNADNNGHYFATNKDLLRLCYIINNNYYSILNDKNRYSPYIAHKYNLDNSFINYINDTYNILKPTIINALNSMVKRKEILLGTGYKIRQNGLIVSAVSGNSLLGKEIFRIQGNAMKQLGVEKYSDLWGKFVTKKQEYFDLCDSMVYDNVHNNDVWIKNGWQFDGFYQCYEIILNVEKIKYDLSLLIDAQKDLNIKINDKIHKSKVLRDLTYNEIDKCFYILNTHKGDVDYPIVEDIKKLK